MDTVLAVVAFTAVALVAGAAYLWRRGSRQQAVLMLVLAVVMIVNVLIWIVPTADGTAPIDQVEATGG